MPSSKEEQLWAASTEGHLDLVKLLLNDPAINVNWGDAEYDRTAFYMACSHNQIAVVEYLLKQPRVDVKKPVNVGHTPFFIACQFGHPNVVKLLLADIRIDVNQPQNTGVTPFYMACQQNHQEIVALLLADTRIDINKPQKDQCTPLWAASQDRCLSVVQLIILSGRKVDTQPKSRAGPAPWNNKTPAEYARFLGTRGRYDDESEEEYARIKHNCPLIATLIDSFDADPFTTRQQLRELRELRDPFISDLFSLVIFLCDELLTVSTEPSLSIFKERAVRFFKIAQCLPMELEMVLCNRAFGAGKNSVLTQHSEPAFKKLGKLLAIADGQ